MKRVTTAILGVLVLSLAAACTPAPPVAPPGPTPAEMVAAAEALDQRFLAAFNSGNVEGLADVYWNNPGLVTISPEAMITKGWDAAKAGSVEMFKAMPGLKLEFTESHNDVHGDVVLGWGTFKMTIPTPGGPQLVDGRFSDVKAMKDGKWVYLMDHASVPLPPPPPESVKK